MRREVEPGRFLVECDSLPSTMDAARQALADDTVIGVRADYQSEGRGRRGAPWVARPRTCLLVTYILHSTRKIEPARLSFAAGVAIAESIESLTGIAPGLKWPNDVLMVGRKVAGILIETESRNALVGVGVNVNVADFPSDLSASATSLLLQTGQDWQVEDIEQTVRARLFAVASAPWPDILGRWRRLDQTTGRQYVAIIDGVEVAGSAVGVDESGALLLRTSAGDVLPVLSATSMT